ncbi:MAG: DUF1828 domain-containing protein [Eubacteriales bacterium]|nr:DUF1828 domain-containing protein [Eubacteriales bacterium]
MKLEEQLESFFRDKIKVGRINPQKYPIAVPMYKTDSGLYEIYLIVANDGHFYLSDEGATLKELDQIFELSEPDVIKNLVAILKQYGCRKEGNNIVIDCTPKNIHINLSYLIQAISFMLNMKIFYV